MPLIILLGLILLICILVFEVIKLRQEGFTLSRKWKNTEQEEAADVSEETESEPEAEPEQQSEETILYFPPPEDLEKEKHKRNIN